MSDNNIENLDWSSWLDFNEDSITNVPESEGVYKMHASMKILYIGNSNNIRQSLLESLSNSCLNKVSTRFSYVITKSSNKIKEFLLNEYRNKHDGKLPMCMKS
jgi:excinuclease UvrABC nuclease subunit